MLQVAEGLDLRGNIRHLAAVETVEAGTIVPTATITIPRAAAPTATNMPRPAVRLASVASRDMSSAFCAEARAIDTSSS